MGNVIVAGQSILLRPLEKVELKGIYADAKVNFDFYETDFQKTQFLLLKPKKEGKLPPLQYRNIAGRINGIKGLPCVFLFDNLAAYERNRLIERGVYFIVSDKYVYLPFLLINAKPNAEVKTDVLLPAAQYILLYHLQAQSLKGCGLSQLEEILPYKYVTLSRAVRQLEVLNLCEIIIDDTRQKRLCFAKNKTKLELWKKAIVYMQSPIKYVYYPDTHFYDNAVCGINALSLYSHLNPDEQPSFAISEVNFKILKKQNKLQNLNQIEGNVKLEIWKYPPIINNIKQPVVDRLSLYLTLKNDPDARVEKELEQMMNELW